MRYDDASVVLGILYCGLFDWVCACWIGGRMRVLIESVLRISLPKYTVRVWQQRDKDYQHQAEGITEIEMEAHKYQDLPAKELALHLLLTKGVSAVEVLDWDNKGLVCYSDW